jgi:uncharacterized protein
MSDALIVFVKNLVPGKVKTRLAKTVGTEQALQIYQLLLTHTRTVCEEVHAERFIFYSDFIEANDEWQPFQKRLQRGNDLGERMSHAFAEIFDLGYSNVIIVGSDCIELTAAIIQEAFDELQRQDIVVGPAADGGYYLLGMKQLHVQLFANKKWSTEQVFNDTISDIEALRLSYKVLPVLNDIDDETDLNKIDLSLL